MSRNFYAIVYNSFSINDSDEKIRDWGTAEIVKFDSKKERDNFCYDKHWNYPISARRAKYILGV